MDFFNNIKNAFTSEFALQISLEQLFLSVIISFIIGVLILFVYKKTYTGVLFNNSFSLTLVLLAMVTSIVIRTISSNLSLSLGMVGALSIVRFRTAVKEPMDTVFMFWALTGGIMAGAGLYTLSIISSLLLAVLFFVIYSYNGKIKTSSYLLVVRYENSIREQVQKMLDTIPKSRLKSQTVISSQTETTLEARFDPAEFKILNDLESIDGVLHAALISCQSENG